MSLLKCLHMGKNDTRTGQFSDDDILNWWHGNIVKYRQWYIGSVGLIYLLNWAQLFMRNKCGIGHSTFSSGTPCIPLLKAYKITNIMESFNEDVHLKPDVYHLHGPLG